MFKLLLLLFVSTSSFAATVILEKHSMSGYVPPEHSFVKDCRIYKEGVLESVTKKGDGTNAVYTQKVSFLNIQTIKAILRLASQGHIEDAPTICDGGTTIVKGHIGGEIVTLESSMDCTSSTINKSASARLLRSMAETLCGF